MIWDSPWFIVIVVIGFFSVLALLSRVATGVSRTVAADTVDCAKSLVKAANKWAVMASQDESALIALMHINYAMAYANALRKIMNDQEIYQATGADMRDMHNKFEITQQGIMSRICETCPSLKPEGEYAVHTGWVD
jgi:hypothetical protein